MLKPSLSSFSLCVLVCGASLLLAQATGEPTIIKEYQSVGNVPCSPIVRERMQRVQNLFNDTNDSHWFRLAFVATIDEIRPRREDDIIMGAWDETETQVVVLQLREMAQLANGDLDLPPLIICAVGKLQDVWNQRKSQNVEMIFEYNRIGKIEFVQKFGC